MNNNLSSWVRSVAIAASVTAVMLAVLIISAEEVPALKDWLKATFYHHWLGKGALALILFVVSSVIFKKRDVASLAPYLKAEAIIVALAVCSIAGFFLLHLLGAV